jgi:hypothetical protein
MKTLDTINGPSPTTHVGGGTFKSKGKRRKSANHPSNIKMKGQAGMTTTQQAGSARGGAVGGMQRGSAPGAKPW